MLPIPAYQPSLPIKGLLHSLQAIEEQRITALILHTVIDF